MNQSFPVLHKNSASHLTTNLEYVIFLFPHLITDVHNFGIVTFEILCYNWDHTTDSNLAVHLLIWKYPFVLSPGHPECLM